MNLKDGAHFVGAYASFPVQARIRRVEILRSFLALEDGLRAKRIKYGPIRGHLNIIAFSTEKLNAALNSLESGESDYLQLFNYQAGEDWIGASENSISVDWSSSVVGRLDRSPSPVEERFGYAGSIRIAYPQSRFFTDLESPFQKKLLTLMKNLWAQSEFHWAFVHQGFHPVRPYSIGQDDVFRATRNGFPLTSFDNNIATPIGIYKEWIGGAFWANFLNSFHASRLGGLEKVTRERPCETVEPLHDKGVMLQVTASPLTGDPPRSIEKYQHLRRFLSPILLETGEDMIRIQKQILGSWRPPAAAEQKWQEDMALIRKQNQAESIDRLTEKSPS